MSPFSIISRWSGFAWDSNRGDIIIFGGGHANYSGNDVYRWHASNFAWERASLPSEIFNDPVSGFHAIDGVDNAPSSAHTYDNNVFLPVVDRFLTFGGAAWDNGAAFLRVSETNPTQTRVVGPYLFDPNRADGNKVGGTTGSNVQRVTGTPIAGGQMWQNRDLVKNVPGDPMAGMHRQGCTGPTIENGKDVVYVGAPNYYGSQLELYRYQLTDINTPALDTVTKVGYYNNTPTNDTVCAYDPTRKLFVRTGYLDNSVLFTFWDLTAPGPGNLERQVQLDSTQAAFQAWLNAQGWSITTCGLDFDAVRRTFPIWCGGGVVWELAPPASGNTTTGWSIVQRPTPVTAYPTTSDHDIEVLGKWKYVPYFNVFATIEDVNNGVVWFYKPVGWTQPVPTGDALPTVSVTSPVANTTFAPGVPITLTANAVDTDGTVARVEYYVNGSKVGQSSQAPYTVQINPVLVGPYSIVAVAVDNVGGMGKSTPLPFTIAATLTTTVLQRGVNGYAGSADTYLDAYQPSVTHGADTTMIVDQLHYTPLVRFAIFQSEGGPVPNGAVLQSATLSLHKETYNDTLQINALLKPWTEAGASWSGTQPGVPWTVAGALGSGTDYVAAPDDVVDVAYNPQWVDFDVASRVQLWSSGGANYGWKVSQTTTNYFGKFFETSEYASDPTLRPKLTLVWSAGATNQPPTVSITAPPNGSSIGLGGSFTFTANASDPGGSVTKVEYFANGVSIGQSTTSPYTVSWTPATVNTYTVTAVATDNMSATTTSAPISLTVTSAGGTSVVLQRGLSGYNGVTDTYLDSYQPTFIHGSDTTMFVDQPHYRSLVRFAIFQSEGGPVPNGSTIQSATLALYNVQYNDTLQVNALLNPWAESQANWNNRQSGVPWNVAGANGSGSDFAATADAQTTTPYTAAWAQFDVTNRVQSWSSGVANYGWRVSQSTTFYFFKTLYTSDYTANTTLRPKLTIVYH